MKLEVRSYMLDRRSGKNLYLQIIEILTEDLEHMPFGEQIATETELAERYKVSRGTIRQAIARLESQGLVFKIQGKGTFKGGHLVQHASFIMGNFTQQLLAQQMIPGIRNVSVKKEQADEIIASYLAIPVGADVWSVRRDRLANGVPINFSTGYIPTSVVSKLRASDLEMSIIDMLGKKFGHRVYTATNLCSATLSDKYVAKRLNIEEGAALMVLEFIGMNQKNCPVLYDKSYLIGNTFSLRIDQIISQ
ncbi:MAG TPA: GntR family transcriptional regulator [Clostridiaceae bacterium]|nr:GntR family transcriptional regulator [Clostridiaceae bacterium]